MGRAHEVRAASMAKTAARKSKLYSIYAKEIYQAAKGNPDPVNNLQLRRIIEKAKRDDVPADVINRNIDKVKKGITEDYVTCEYEAFGPGSSNLIIKCLTDNSNRTISELKTVFNKCGAKMATPNAVSFMYEHLSVIGVKGLDEETIMDSLIYNNIDVNDIEVENDMTLIYAAPQDLNNMKTALESIKNDIVFEIDEISYFPKDTVQLDEEQMTKFQKLLTMLDDLDDVSNVYHNVEIN